MKKRIKQLVCVMFVAFLGLNFAACVDIGNVDFRLTFDDCGSRTGTQTVQFDGSSKLQIPPVPEKDGFMFGGWFWDKDVWEKPLTVNPILDAPLSSNMTVYARWLPVNENSDAAPGTDKTPDKDPPVLPRLGTPKNLRLSGTHLAWDFLPDVVGYMIDIDGIVFDSGWEIPMYDLSSLTAYKTYKIKVMAKGDGIVYADSFWSDVIAYTIDKDTDEGSSAGLDYRLINGGRQYAVSRGMATAARIIIPATYNSLPVTEIESKGFEDYTALEKILIPDSIISIGSFSFLNCFNLKDIDIPDSVETIQSYAFQNCSGIKTVVIGKGVKKIESNPFYACSYIENITVSDGNTVYKSEGNCLIRVADSVLITGCYNSVIPRGIIMLDTFAFSHIYNLETIIIPVTVVKMGANVFNVCRKLTIYAEVASVPDGWGYSWNPSNRPVAWNYKGEPFEDVVIPEPFIDRNYDCIKYDIKNATCEKILIKFYTAYQEEEIGAKTLAYGTILAFGKLAYGYGDIDWLIKCGRNRSGYGIGIKNEEMSAETLASISHYWTLIKPIISNTLRSEGFSYKIYNASYGGGLYTIDYYIDKMISGIADGKMVVMDAINYISAVFAASYGKADCSGPKLSSEITY